MRKSTIISFAIQLLILFLGPAAVFAHCDSADGPVVRAGKMALETGNLTPALKWVKADAEQELRDTFDVVKAARVQGTAAMRSADRLFLETLVRLHRAGEGEPFEGIKAAGTGVTPAIAAADEAIDKQSVVPLQKVVCDELTRRFGAVIEAKKHENDSVDAGRAYVASYAEFIHYVDRVESALTGHSAEERGMNAMMSMDEANCPMHKMQTAKASMPMDEANCPMHKAQAAKPEGERKQ